MRRILCAEATISALTLLFVAFWAGCSTPLPAASSQAERDSFDQTKRKADKGDAQAQLQLGSMYAQGEVVRQDPRKAVKWHRKAAEQGLGEAEYHLALDYSHGFGVKEDSAEAFLWFRRAAQKGVAEAQVDLGLCYAKGRGVEDNAVEAVYWFRKAAEQGNAEARYQLGQCYFEGRGVTKNTAEGFKWTQLAAEQGNASGECRLGLCYERGEGVAQDHVQAHKWYNLAAAQDDQNAADIRVTIAKIETSLTKDQIVEAQRLARDFKPSERPASGGVSADTGSSAAKAGFVNLQTDDESCEVFVDGLFFGNPPARLKLTDGTHLIEVKKPGFKDYRRQVTVTTGSDLNLRVTLEKL